MQQRIILFFFLAFIAGCAPSLMMPIASDTERVKGHFAEVSFAQLQSGYTLYVNKCGGCHLLYKPTEYSDSHWKKSIIEMSERAHLDNAQSELILKYLLSKCAVLQEETGR